MTEARAALIAAVVAFASSVTGTIIQATDSTAPAPPVSCSTLVANAAKLAKDNRAVARLYGEPGKNPALTPLASAREVEACDGKDPERILEELYKRDKQPE